MEAVDNSTSVLDILIYFIFEVSLMNVVTHVVKNFSETIFGCR